MNTTITESCKNMSANEIYESLHVKYLNEKYNGAALCDAASLFVLFAYILEKSFDDKEKLRKEAYMAFLSNDRNRFSDAWKCIGALFEKNEPPEIGIKILKGGSYKIKGYYLENNNLNDMRGASILLTHIEENVIPGIISQEYIRECIIYCGGGNIFCILPESVQDDFALRLERTADELLISAKIAYCLSPVMSVGVILGKNYASKMAEIENALDQRKKLKIYNTVHTGSSWSGEQLKIPFEGTTTINVLITAKELEQGSKQFCEACGKRYAGYALTNENKEDEELCAGCLHKRLTGSKAKHGRYYREYERYCPGKKPENNIRTLNNISEDKIAVVYGDGNNMGGIIQGLVKITQMMAFSRDIKNIANKAVFESMGENGIDRFEVVALGGDDIFVIIPAEKSFSFTVSLIEKYNAQFKNKYQQASTMSVGIAAAKTNTPIKIILEAAEDELKAAKSYEKQRPPEERDGSLSFRILDSYDDSNKTLTAANGASGTLLPYSLKTAAQIASAACHFSGAAKSRIRNLLDAFMQAESIDEAELFFRYMNAKANEKDVISLPKIDGYKEENGYYISENNSKYSFIWNDILDLTVIGG